jgi:hypothetical protein
MTRTELFDKLLNHLIDNPNNFWNLIPTCEKYFEVTDRRLIEHIGDELVERGWVTTKKDDKYSVYNHQNGIYMMEKYGSYSSFLRSEKVAQTKAQRSKMTPDIIKIGIAIIFGLSTAILGWLNYIDNKKIDNQQAEIEQLNKAIDSLQTEIKKQHTITKHSCGRYDPT